MNGPRLITITYNGGKSNDAPIALVGKGITYDSGYSIKSKIGMQTMKFDMWGRKRCWNDRYYREIKIAS